MQYLDGDIAVVAQIAREVDGRHAALPKLALEAVATCHRSGKTLGYRRHAVVGAGVIDLQGYCSVAILIEANMSAGLNGGHHSRESDTSQQALKFRLVTRRVP